MIDIDFMEALYDASGVPKNKGKDKIRKYYDATKIPYIFTQSGSVLFHQLFQINV